MKTVLPQNKLELSQNEIHLWHCRFDTSNDRIEAFKRILSHHEKEKAGRFKFDIHREQSIISRGILRTLLGKYFEKHPRELEFGYTAYDKPYLKNESSLRFNVSHSGNRAVFGFVQDGEIGVDIEKVKNNLEVMDIAQHFFSSDEIKALEVLPLHERIAAFYRCWTRKESFIKAKGSGLSFPLTSFSVSLDAEKAEVLRTDWDTGEKAEWRMFSFEPDEGYLGALSVRANCSNLRQMDWDAIYT
ncbi:4'-phosphopantetheinyl transferase superfamily protein [Pricia sp.]|uniref:4'-phosphopantetheinyl transferase family protein n=1 Tax=Pricia sp. TaxID=2268138 RepID=UPI0035939E42